VNRRLLASAAAAVALASVPALRPAAGQAAPSASAQVGQGARHYQEHCALCHGADGRGGQGFPRPIWGDGHDLKKFNTAQGLFEYVQLLMPFDDPQKLNDVQKLAVVAFLLERNANIAAGTELTPGNAARVAIR
jgi:mono/diheme cytochrome c family protein